MSADPAQERYRRLLEAAPDPTIAVSSDGRIALANALAEKLFGLDRTEMVGLPVEALVPEAAREAHVRHRTAYFEQPASRPMGAGLELAGRHRDGSYFPVEISLAPIETEFGQFVAAAIRDITDRKRFELDLQQKNAELEMASSVKDRFLASMSHQLRTPLNAILGFTGILLMGLPGPLNEEQQNQLKTVRDAAHHLLAIINDLLDLAKIESGKVELALENVDVHTVIDGIAASLRPLAEAKGLDFEVESPRAVTPVRADQRVLSQILINLVNNAIKFTEEGGIRITLDERRLEAEPGVVTIDVIDTGIGVAAEDVVRVFEPFEQLDRTKTQEGTGLGLHISRKLGQLLGASIRCESSLGQGSTFTVEIPRR